MSHTVRVPGRELPVLYEVDAAVAGATLAGTAAAVALAAAGRRVLLLDAGYALGTDLTAANRPWLTVSGPPTVAGGPAAGLLQALLPPGAPAGTRVPLRPAEVKLHLEDALLDAGGQLLYGARPLAVHRRGEAVHGLVIADKSGRQLVRCPLLLDATGTDPVLRGSTGPARPRRQVWSVEVDGAAGPATALAAHPAARDVRLVDGCRGPGHLHAVFAVVGGRRAAVRAAGRLLRAHPGFAKASLGAVATRPLAAPYGSRPDVAPAGPVTPGLWSLPAPPDATDAHGPLLDPLDAVRLGARTGRTLSEAVPGTRSTAVAAVPEVPRGSEAPAAPPSTSSRETVAEQDAPRRGWPYPREAVAGLDAPCHAEVDVLVVGGGTSGASAALAAAREGARTLLVDAGPGPGGTGTYGGVHSYWFGRRAGHAARLQQATRLTHRGLGLRGGVGQWSIEAKALALHEALRDAEAETVYGAGAFAALRDGSRVTGALFAGDDGPFAVRARVVVDATGDADLAAWCGAPCDWGAAGVHTAMWASLARFEAPGLARNNFGGLADPTDVVDTTRAVLAARRRSAGMHDHGIQPAARESRHLRGEAVVTLTDQLTGRHWPDVIAVHFSNHDLKGKGEALWPQLGLVPPNLEIELPYRALLPRGLDGLLVTGKALSATHDALPALRMQADLENLGEATGLAAARSAAQRQEPRALDVAALQRELVRRGSLPADVLAGRGPGAVLAGRGPAVAGTVGPAGSRVPADSVACAGGHAPLDSGADCHPATGSPRTGRRSDVDVLIAELADHLPLHTYSDMGRREVFRGRIPFVLLALDLDAGTTRALRRALDAADSVRLRLVVAQLLTLRGERAGADVLVEHLTRRLAGDRLPPRTSRIREAQLPPDQSAMPDEAYLLHTLGRAREARAVPLWERIAELVDAREEAFRDAAAAPFAWVDAVCAGAERLGDPAALGALTTLHGRPALHGQWRSGGIEPDDVQERRALLELGIGRALAHCGDPGGHRVLVRYLADDRAPLAAQAHSRLTVLTGVDHGKDAAAWLRHLDAAGPPAPQPLPYAHDPHAADLPADHRPPGARPAAPAPAQHGATAAPARSAAAPLPHAGPHAGAVGTGPVAPGPSAAGPAPAQSGTPLDDPPAAVPPSPVTPEEVDR